MSLRSHGLVSDSESAAYTLTRQCASSAAYTACGGTSGRRAQLVSCMDLSSGAPSTFAQSAERLLAAAGFSCRSRSGVTRAASGGDSAAGSSEKHPATSDDPKTSTTTTQQQQQHRHFTRKASGASAAPVASPIAPATAVKGGRKGGGKKGKVATAAAGGGKKGKKGKGKAAAAEEDEEDGDGDASIAELLAAMNAGSGSDDGEKTEVVDEEITTVPGEVEPGELEENSRALITAIKQRQEHDAFKLLDQGVDLDYRGMWENTPLILACSYGLNSIAMSLIQRQANSGVMPNIT